MCSATAAQVQLVRGYARGVLRAALAQRPQSGLGRIGGGASFSNRSPIGASSGAGGCPIVAYFFCASQHGSGRVWTTPGHDPWHSSSQHAFAERWRNIERSLARLASISIVSSPDQWAISCTVARGTCHSQASSWCSPFQRRRNTQQTQHWLDWNAQERVFAHCAAARPRLAHQVTFSGSCRGALRSTQHALCIQRCIPSSGCGRRT